MKVSELTGHALNWAVAMAEGDKVYRPRLGRPSDWDKEAYLADGSDDRWVVRVENARVAHFVDWTYNPSGDWMQGGPIIERERINLWNEGHDWEASRHYVDTRYSERDSNFRNIKIGEVQSRIDKLNRVLTQIKGVSNA